MLALGITVGFAVARVVRERRVAVRSQEAAEKLVDYLLRGLREKLQAIGRLDALADLSDEVEKYYVAVTPPGGASPSPAALDRRADALTLFGEVEEAAGRLDSAEEREARAIALYQEVVSTAPSDLEGQRGLCATISMIGDLESSRNRPDAARERFLKSLDCATRAAARHPDDAKLRRQIALQELRLGALDESAGVWAESRKHDLAARASLDEAARLGGDVASDQAWISAALCSSARRSGQFEEAVTEGTRAIEERRALLHAAPNDTRRALDLAIALKIVVRLDYNLGRWAPARERIAEAVALAEGVAAREPRNLDWQFNLIDSLNDQCDVLLGGRELEAATPECARALELARKLAEAGPQYSKYAGAAATAAWQGGRLALARGDVAGARTQAGEAAEWGKKETDLEKNGIFGRQRELMAAHLLGQAAMEGKDGPGALAAFRHGLELAQQLVAEAKSHLYDSELAELTFYVGEAEAMVGDTTAARRDHELSHKMAVEQSTALPTSAPLAILVARTALRLADTAADPATLRAEARAALERIGEDHLDADSKALLLKLRGG
jgi:tetratricopeptide (TPR) repeat protein